ncbi:MAG: hypothetical protein NC911_09970 [Candidatus Omnitrophica bacterium]|nr:hypothetical protein [Candidatus Omnitrophota bacterium]
MKWLILIAILWLTTFPISGQVENGENIPPAVERHREALRLLQEMRRIEEETVKEDPELQQLRKQFRHRLRQKLKDNQEYSRLKKKLEETGFGLGQTPVRKPSLSPR